MIYCKNCGKVLEGDPRFCMHCGAELYPTRHNKPSPNINKSYLALWSVMGALIVGLFWVANINSDKQPGVGPIDTTPNIGPASTDNLRPEPNPPQNEMTAVKRAELESDAETAITHYANAVSNGKKSVAMSYWKNPTNKVSKQLDSLVSIKLISSKSTLKSERSAETWVDWIVSSTSKSGEHWRGTILQEKPGDTWLIASMKGMKCIDGCGVSGSTGSNSDEADDGPSIQSVVTSYYEALSNNNGSAARAKWKTPPKLLNSMLGRIDFATVNRMDDPVINGTKASVWVDLTIKAKGKSAETWKGKVSLERFGNSGWLITSLSNMTKR